MWDILQSPISLELECRHRVDFCAACLQSHLRAQLEQHGRGAADRLSCPALDCSRNLTYQEIRLYADYETFVRYDKYLQLEALSRMPNFRRCLGPNCDSGQLYKGDDADDDDDADDENGPEDPYIQCGECGFEMCFEHSVPWHAGLTCEQYDGAREHGDPEFVKTRSWIRTNTKPCPGPGCGENIQKGEACFHMTCEYLAHFTFSHSPSYIPICLVLFSLTLRGILPSYIYQHSCCRLHAREAYMAKIFSFIFLTVLVRFAITSHPNKANTSPPYVLFVCP
jgi:hypothetical protein